MRVKCYPAWWAIFNSIFEAKPAGRWRGEEKVSSFYYPAASVPGHSLQLARLKANAPAQLRGRLLQMNPNGTVPEVPTRQRRPVGCWDFSRMPLCWAAGMEEPRRSCCAGCKPEGYLLALGWSSLGWVFWPQGCLHREDGTKQPLLQGRTGARALSRFDYIK